ncbi:glycoside hydrolase family 92 protein [Novosphingobium profundi]|nr:glycoside hydrolase family 92 protein [Novosphingobium profundi]
MDKPSRREVLAGTLVTAAAALAISPARALAHTEDRHGAALAAKSGPPLATQPSRAIGGRAGLRQHVDPFIGTGGHGHTYPGATMPFGMVQLSPDTDNARWDACSGYHADDRTILGFSHTHLSGTGVGDMLDVLVVPRTGKVILDPGTREKPEGSYRQGFDHADEHAEPGYYRVALRESGITAELTATERVGIHRYHFPEAGHLLIDFTHGSRGNPVEPTHVSDASLKVVAPDLIVGSRRVHGWADGRLIHFAMRLSRPCAQAVLYGNDRPLPEGSMQIEGAALKCALHFPDASDDALVIKVGLSGVDVDGAMRNLDTEAPGWDFEGYRGAAAQAWERELARITVDGADPEQAAIFYTGLYHAMLAPTLFSDVDGRTRGMDTAIHTLPAEERAYSTYSLWDTYRALHPLFTLIQSERNAELVRDLVRIAEQSPWGPAIWPLQGVETRCMIGWHSAVVIAEACAKAVPGIDYTKAWSLYRRRAFEDEVFDLAAYRTHGYVPADVSRQSVSKTLEYAYDDWAMACLAQAAGAYEDASQLRARARSYANVFDRETQFVRPRLSNGQWAQPFDPRSNRHDPRGWVDFTESNAWQATFLNQHDVHHYITLFGGDAAFAAKLDGLFAASSELPPGMPPDVSGMVGQYAHGNEPSHHVAYLYAYAGQAWKTQDRVRSLLETQYRAAPDGLSGNEDCGQMSAWYVMSALGLYAVDPVSGNYVFGSPIFPRTELELHGGRRLVIAAPHTSARNRYVHGVQWNGRPWDRSWISHRELAKGGRLAFDMRDTPNPEFGADPAARPPSLL